MKTAGPFAFTEVYDRRLDTLPDDNAANLDTLGFITRIPHTIGAITQAIRQALTAEPGTL